MLRLITLIGLLGIGNTAMAEPVRMSGDDIKRAMPGALLEIDTPLRISIPVKVGTDGLVSAEAGALGLTLGATKDRGRWWTDGDKLCMKWFRWFDAKPRCMVLLREGNRVQWSEGSGESGTATITEAAPVVAAVEPRHTPKKKKLIEPVADPAPAAAPVNIEVAEATPPPAAAPTSDKSPALQFAAAALSQVLPPPAEAKPSGIGMSDTASTEQPVAYVADEPAQAAPEPAAPVRETVAAPKQRKVKPVAVALHAPAVRKSASAPVRREETQKPVQNSFRVSGVVAGDTLNVRNGPSEYHPLVGRIPASGRGVQIVGACRDLWCPIRHGRLNGWVNRYYLVEDMSRASSGR
jgi:Bacterial SH3 domain